MGSENRRKITLLKMDTTAWSSLLVTLFTLITPGLSTEPRVVCYYTNWSVYRPGSAKFNPQNINPYLCTHLVYAFGGFTKENELKPFDKYQDIEKGGYAKFNGLKTYNKNLKTILAIGGWNEGSARFSPMVASRKSRKEFVRNAIRFLRQNHFDGLDLDWEYPAFRDGGQPKDRENYAKLVKELREEFEKESEKTGKPRLLLTMAVPAGIQYIEKGYDIKTLNQYLDWMNLLAYDYHSAFEPAVNHHAPLYPLEEPNEYSVDDDLNIDYTIKAYVEHGADRDKLVVGIPTYGRSYTLFNPDSSELGSPADGPGEQGDATREKGYLAYYEICEGLLPKPKKTKPQNSDEDDDDESEEVELQWTVVHPNPDAMGPYAYRGNQWVGYDDIDIVKKKGDYVAENGLGGIMFWSIDNDDFRGTCHGKPYPLIEAAKEAYIAKLGSRNNAVVSENKQPAPSYNSRRRSRPRSSTPSTVSTPSTTARSSPISKNRNNRRRPSSPAPSTTPPTTPSPLSPGATPAWSAPTPEPPTTPDPASDFKCKDEGFFSHPRDCKKYFWCLDSGPSNLGIVAHQFTCPSGLYFNKAADSCDFARNVLCKTKSPASTTKASTTSTTTTTTTTVRPIKLSSKSSSLFRTTTTTTTTPEPETEEEYEDEENEDVSNNEDAEDPKVLKDLIDLIKKLGGVDQLEKHLRLGEALPSTDGAVSTTPISYNKKLYQVLQRTQAKTTLSDNSVTETTVLNRRGPQSAGLNSLSYDEKTLRKDRPKYVTINRGRALSTTIKGLLEDEEEEIESEEEPELNTARTAGPEAKGSTTKPLQYVNIRRARPTITTSDTADDTASRNALFERVEPIVTVSEHSNSLDFSNARRENIFEYVTIRRQRPTTEEATTVKYQSSEGEAITSLEKELSSSSSQPSYTSIERSRTTTVSPPEDLTSPEPTTVLAVKLSSLLNSPNPTEVDSPKPELALTSEATEPPTQTSTMSSTTTTTTTTAAPSSLSTRRIAVRRRGTTSTTTTTPASPSTTQAASDYRRPFNRRTKATSPLETQTESTKPIETTTRKFSRRGNSRFRSRKEPDPARTEPATERTQPSVSTSESTTTTERVATLPSTRNFFRRRLGGASVTTTLGTTTSTTTPAPTTVLSSSRRPFRVASRKRLSTRSTTTTSTTLATTVAAGGEADDSGSEGHTISESQITTDGTIRKFRKRPLVNDQNQSATNEEEKKRQSKKYSASLNQNQLEDMLKQRISQEESDVTTEGKPYTTSKSLTTVEEFNPETAVAIAAHQLFAAPLPVVTNYDEEPRRTTSRPSTEYRTTKQYSATNNRSPVTVYSEEYPSTSYETSPQTEAQTSSSGETSPNFSRPSYSTPKVTETIISVEHKPKTTSAANIPKSYNSKGYPASSEKSYLPTDYTSRAPTDYTSREPTEYTSRAPTEYTSRTRIDYTSREPTEYTSRAPTEYTSRTRTDYTSREPTEYTSRAPTEYTSRTRTDYTSREPTEYTSRTPTVYTSRTPTEYNSRSPTEYTSRSPTTLSELMTKYSEFTGPQTTLNSGYRDGYDDSKTSPFDTNTLPRFELGYTSPVSSSGSVTILAQTGRPTARYLSQTDKNEIPVEQFGFSTTGFAGYSEEPSYYTKDYLLESPGTKNSEEQFQYLSSVTTQRPTDTPAPTTYRKISTTVPPTTEYVSQTNSSPARKVRPTEGYEKIKKTEPNRTRKPEGAFDYYDETDERVAQKYLEGTKVVVHPSGSIECLDMGNFPHPTSCKKFIQCARMESGATVGWEYICPKGLSYDPVGGICNWSAGLGCREVDLEFTSHPRPEEFGN